MNIDNQRDELRAFAATTPFSEEELQNATRVLLHMASLTKDTTETLKDLGDSIADAGKGADQFQRIIIDLPDNQQVDENEMSVVQVGEDKVYSEVKKIIDAHNKQIRAELGALGKFTTDRMYREGGEIIYDTFGRQLRTSGSETVGLPLYRSEFDLPFTRDWLEQHTREELMEVLSAELAQDSKRIQDLITDIIFTNEDRLDYQDNLAGDFMAYPCRSFKNNEDDNHYLVSEGDIVTAEDIRRLLLVVLDHEDETTDIQICINRAQESTVWGMVGAFYPFVPDNIREASAQMRGSERYSPGRHLIITDSFKNRAIGRFDAAEVWVKSWVPKGYFCVLAKGSGGKKPLYIRETHKSSPADIRLRSLHEHFPLRTSKMRRDIGIGVRYRHLGACMQIGATEYSYEPTYNLDYRLREEPTGSTGYPKTEIDKKDLTIQTQKERDKRQKERDARNIKKKVSEGFDLDGYSRELEMKAGSMGRMRDEIKPIEAEEFDSLTNIPKNSGSKRTK